MNKIMNLSDTIRLSNGVEMPVLGFGTMPSQWGMKADEKFIRTVETAIKVGYRNVDTAVVYFNEAEVGEAIRRSIYNGIIKREDISAVPSYGIQTEDMTRPSKPLTLPCPDWDWIILICISYILRLCNVGIQIGRK